MATYSLAITGSLADSPWVTEPYTLDDAFARPGDMANAMQTGSQFLCKGPDGAQAWYTLDAERSTPDRPVLLKV